MDIFSSRLQSFNLESLDVKRLSLRGLYWSLVILHLVMLNRISSQFDALVVVGFFWYVLSQRLEKSAEGDHTDSGILVSLVAYGLIACVIARSFSFFWFDPTFLSAMPFLIVLAIVLLTAGMKLWKFSVEFLFCGTLLVPMEMINTWFEQGAGLPLQIFTAKVSSFVLYYLGLPVESQQTIIRLPQGAVNVQLACTSFSAIFSLCQVSFLLILLMPLSRWALGWVFSLTFVMTQLVSIFRVALLAFVVDQPELFEFWHDDQGQQIVSTFLILFLGITYYLFYLREMDEQYDVIEEGEAIEG